VYCCWMESWLVDRGRLVEEKGCRTKVGVGRNDDSCSDVTKERKSSRETGSLRRKKRRLQLGNTVVKKGERVNLGHGRSSGLRSVGLRSDPASEPRCARLLEVDERGVVADPVLPEDDHVVFPPEIERKKTVISTSVRTVQDSLGLRILT
jgi:hypothetical protein